MNETGLDPATGEVDTTFVEQACGQLLGSMPLQSFALVIRAGAKGSYIAKNGGRSQRPSVVKRKRPANHGRGGLMPDTDIEALFAGLMQGDGSFERVEPAVDPGVEMWMPAYHTDSKKVVDPTGAGNGFLGGLAVALARGKGLEEAAAWASVAASFAIEQVGMPKLGNDEKGVETWNGVYVDKRLKEFQKRLEKQWDSMG